MNIHQLFANTTPSAPTTKTAQEEPPASPNSAVQASMQSTLAAAASEQTKLAAQQAVPRATPGTDLEKLAEELAQASAQRNIKLAQEMGRAFGDGMLERIAAYERTAEKLAAAREEGLSPEEQEAAYNHFLPMWTEAMHTKTAEHYLHGQQLVAQLAQPSQPRE